mgnify:CR=1 FL=1|jgi:hypothetical protein
MEKRARSTGRVFPVLLLDRSGFTFYSGSTYRPGGPLPGCHKLDLNLILPTNRPVSIRNQPTLGCFSENYESYRTQT